MFWYETKLAHSGRWAIGQSLPNKSGLSSNQHNAQYSCSLLCDAVVDMWRLAALNPLLSFDSRRSLAHKLAHYHKKTIEVVWRVIKEQVGWNNRFFDVRRAAYKAAAETFFLFSLHILNWRRCCNRVL